MPKEQHDNFPAMWIPIGFMGFMLMMILGQMQGNYAGMLTDILKHPIIALITILVIICVPVGVTFRWAMEDGGGK